MAFKSCLSFIMMTMVCFIFLEFAASIPIIYKRNLKYARLQSKMLKPKGNVCKDPVHIGKNDRELIGSIQDKQFWLKLHSETRKFIDILDDTTRAFEKKHIDCSKRKKMLESIHVEDVVHIQRTTPSTQNPITRQYLEIGKLTFLSQILDSSFAKECCMNPLLKNVGSTLKNTILHMWHTANISFGDADLKDACKISGHVTIFTPMDCIDLSDVIYTVLLHNKSVLKETIPVLEKQMSSN